MEKWFDKLLELFKDPLLANVHPPVPKPTANERSAQKLEEINRWIEEHGREPRRTEGDLNEKRLGTALAALRRSEERNALLVFDRLNLLDA